jgi:hypothetical protein
MKMFSNFIFKTYLKSLLYKVYIVILKSTKIFSKALENVLEKSSFTKYIIVAFYNLF